MPLKGDTLGGNDVWIGQKVTIMPGVHIGDGAIIGANPVVASDIPPYAVAVGNVEGCCIPSGWRNDFSEQYMRLIRFICLAMSDAYIEAHIDEMRNHASTIGKRLCDTGCTIESLKFDNQYYIDVFTRCGEQITMIETGFWQTEEELVEL